MLGWTRRTERDGWYRDATDADEGMKSPHSEKHVIGCGRDPYDVLRDTAATSAQVGCWDWAAEHPG
jgi:hypothetical protein